MSPFPQRHHDLSDSDIHMDPAAYNKSYRYQLRFGGQYRYPVFLDRHEIENLPMGRCNGL